MLYKACSSRVQRFYIRTGAFSIFIPILLNTVDPRRLLKMLPNFHGVQDHWSPRIRRRSETERGSNEGNRKFMHACMEANCRGQCVLSYQALLVFFHSNQYKFDHIVEHSHIVGILCSCAVLFKQIAKPQTNLCPPLVMREHKFEVLNTNLFPFID